MIGVAASCFLKGPVATLMTFSVLIVGVSFRSLVDKIVSGDQLGGGPTESIYRMITHLNQTVDMDLSRDRDRHDQVDRLDRPARSLARAADVSEL